MSKRTLTKVVTIKMCYALYSSYYKNVQYVISLIIYYLCYARFNYLRACVRACVCVCWGGVCVCWGSVCVGVGGVEFRSLCVRLTHTSLLTVTGVYAEAPAVMDTYTYT